MGKYRNKFFVDDVLVSIHNYAYIPYGTTVKVAAITPTGSIKLAGITGSYNPDNFKHAHQNKTPTDDKFAIIYDDSDYARTVTDEQSMKGEVKDAYVLGYSNLKVYRLGEQIDITDIIREDKEEPLFYIYGYKKGSEYNARYYAKRNSNSGRPLSFGWRPAGCRDLTPFLYEDGDKFTLAEAKSYLKYYRDSIKYDYFWIRDLALEPVDS